MAKKVLQSRKRRGPLLTGKGVPVQTRLHPAMLERLDGWRAGQDGKLSRPEALRRLATIGLEVEAKRTR